MLYTTGRLARKAGACESSYRKMARALGGARKYGQDTPVPLDKILEVCGFRDALWCLRCTTENSDRFSRLLACRYAEEVLPIYEKEYPDDKRPREAIETARRFANGEASDEERDAAWAAAGAAAWDARDAARDAAWAAAGAARAAWAAAGAAAWDARAAARAAQEKLFLEMLREYK